MMAERLAQMRAEYDSIEGKPNHTVGHIRELLDHIAQLEAQRGELARELDLTKREAWTAKERHKDERDRADGLRERLDELSAEVFERLRVASWHGRRANRAPENRPEDTE
jgi:predicted nuclease with TOPRIM domain